MEQNHMPGAPRSPQIRPSEGGPNGTAMQNSTSPDALAADTLAGMHASPDREGSEQRASGDLSARFNSSLSLHLPPLALSFSNDPVTELAPIQPPQEKAAGSSVPTLPPLSSVTGPQAHVSLPKPPEPARPAPYAQPTNHWPSLNPFTTYYTPSHLDPVESSPSMGSDRSVSLRGASVSLDDPDVRIAAEALGQMRTDCGSSPRNPRDRKASGDSKMRGSHAEPEPLLSLITTSHPLLATTIEGAASAYNTGKNYSPHIKSSAEYVESCLKPVGKAVGNVGRKTGVEGGVRWIFGIRSRKQHSTTDIETGERGNSKRRKSDRNGKAQNVVGVARPESDVESEDRRMSVSTVDTLPAYDDSRSPAYTETADDQGSPGAGAGTPGAPGQQWGQRFVVTTSGLGVAMKEESLKSLKYCVRVVKDANGYISDVLVNLKSVIDEYDRGYQADGEDHTMADGDHPNQHTAADRNRLIQRMGELRDDLFRVIHRTVQTVSKYAGSALPENARNLVHRQLMSLPGLYQFHYERESEGRSETASPEAWARDSAHLALLFAKEALQMMTQVGDVLNRTLVSAEEWCDTLYRKKNEQSRSPLGITESLPAPQLLAANQDSNMSG